MRILLLAVTAALALPFICLAEPSVGKLTATKGAKLDGVHLPTAGIPSWPVHNGSVIQTGPSPAVVMLNGGTRFEVPANSTAFVERVGSSAPAVRIADSFSNSGAPPVQTALAAAPAQTRLATAAAPPVAQLIEISIVDTDDKGDLGAPPAAPPCSGFHPVLVSLNLVRCTP